MLTPSTPPLPPFSATCRHACHRFDGAQTLSISEYCFLRPGCFPVATDVALAGVGGSLGSRVGSTDSLCVADVSFAPVPSLVSEALASKTIVSWSGLIPRLVRLPFINHAPFSTAAPWLFPTFTGRFKLPLRRQFSATMSRSDSSPAPIASVAFGLLVPVGLPRQALMRSPSVTHVSVPSIPAPYT